MNSVRSDVQSILGIACAAVLLNCIDAVGARAAEPYDLRGIKLGMSLSEFRALPHPDGKSAKVICTGDPESKELLGPSLSTYGDELTAGVIACNYYDLQNVSPTAFPSWEEINLNVATVDVFMEYKFLPDPVHNNEPAIYSIVVRSNVGNWDKFWKGYTNKYGKPMRVLNEPTQNTLGATFDNSVAIWGNDKSTITLIKRFSRIDNTYIFYEDKRLSGEFKRKVEAKNRKPSDKL